MAINEERNDMENNVGIDKINELINRFDELGGVDPNESVEDYGEDLEVDEYGVPVKFGISQRYPNRVFWIIPSHFILRRWLIRIVSSIWFEYFIVGLILLNCVTMSLYDPVYEGTRNQIVRIFGYIFSGIFLLELSLKVLAFGFFGHPKAYLRRDRYEKVLHGLPTDKTLSSFLREAYSVLGRFLKSIHLWNLLDMIIILLSVVSVVETVAIGPISIFRVFRVLRPIRTVTNIRSLKIFLSTFVSGLGMLVYCFFLYLWCLVFFSLLSGNLLNGLFRYKCVHSLTQQAIESSSCQHSYQCPFDHVCQVSSPKSLSSFVGFDNFFQSLISVYLISRNFWIERNRAATDNSTLVAIVLTMISWFVFFCVISNLILGIITVSMGNVIRKRNQVNANYVSQRNYFNTVSDRLESRLNHKFFIKGTKLLVFLIESWVFRIFILFFIVLNVTSLAAIHFDQPDWLWTTIEIVNLVCLAVFIIEILLKLVAYRLKFFQDYLNVLDFFIVVTSIIEIPFPFNVLRAFRVIRIFRIFRLLTFVPRLKNIIDPISKSLSTYIIISSLLLLFIFIFSLLGLNIFGGTTTTIDSRKSFDTLYFSIIGVFQIITDTLEKEFLDIISNNLHPAYFVYMFFCGIGATYFFLSLMSALLVSKFGLTSEVEQEKLPQSKRSKYIEKNQKNLASNEIKVIEGNDEISVITASSADQQRKSSILKVNSGFALEDKEMSAFTKVFNVVETESTDNGVPDVIHQPDPLLENTSSETTITASETNLGDDHDSELDDQLPIPTIVKNDKKLDWKAFLLRNPFKSDVSLCFIPPQFPPRRLLRWILETKLFEIFIMLVIILSVVDVILYDPYRRLEEPLSIFLSIAGDVISLLFAIEAVLKIMAYGFIMHPESYLRRSWYNVLDFFLVITSAITFFGSNDIIRAFNVLRSFRSLRALRSIRFIRSIRSLRPLRFLGRFGDFQIILNSLIRSFIPMLNVLLISFLVILFYSILGVELFQGRLYYCTSSWISTKEHCISSGARWINPYYNFDHIGTALRTLIELIFSKQWLNVTYSLMDITEIGRSPRENNSPSNALYVLSFVFVGILLLSFLISTALITTYIANHEREILRGLSLNQKKWFLIQEKLLKTNPNYEPIAPRKRFFWEKYIPIYKLRKAVYRVLQSNSYIAFAMILTILNVIQLAMEYYPADATYILTMNILTDIFTVIFNFDVFAKLLGYGFRGFFQDHWNMFDLLIQLITTGGIIVRYSLPEVFIFSISLIQFFDSFRTFRMFRILKLVKGFKILLETIFFSVPNLIFVSLLYCISVIAFSVLGMYFFGRFGRGDFSHNLKFDTFTNGIFTLILITTGSDWTKMMHALVEGPVGCSLKRGDCVEPYLVYLYFYSFIFLVKIVFGSLFSSVILVQFQSITSDEESSITQNEITAFVEIWYQMNGNSFTMPQENLKSFLQQLGKPLGLNHNATQKEVVEMYRQLDLSIENGKVQFYDVLLHLSEYHFKWVRLPHKLQKKLNRKWKKKISKGRSRKTNQIPLLTDFVLHEITVIAVRVEFENTIETERVEVNFIARVQQLCDRFLAEFNPNYQDSDLGKIYFIGLNMDRTMSNHKQKACKLAVLISELQSTPDFQGMVECSIGISCGKLFSGMFGASLRKHDQNYGGVDRVSQILCKICVPHNADVVCDEGISTSIENQFVVRPIDILKTSNDAYFTLSEIVEVKSIVSAEWFYELEQLEYLNRYDLYIQGWKKMYQEKLDDSIQDFEQYSALDPSDERARKLIHLCMFLKLQNIPFKELLMINFGGKVSLQQEYKSLLLNGIGHGV